MRSRDPKAYKYTFVDAPIASELTKLDIYIFVVRIRVGKFTVIVQAAS